MAKKIKLLLFTPIESRFPSLGQPLGLGYLAAYLERHLPNLDIVIETSPHNCLENILRYSPDVLGFSSPTAEWTKVTEVAKQIHSLELYLKNSTHGKSHTIRLWLNIQCWFYRIRLLLLRF